MTDEEMALTDAQMMGTVEEGGPDSFLNRGVFKPSRPPVGRALENTGSIEQVRRDLDPQQYPTPDERVKRGFMMGADPSQGSAFDVAPSEGEIQQGIDFTKKHGRPMDPMEADPIAQSVVLSAVLGPLGRAAANTMAPHIGAVPAGGLVGAGEAALGAKSTGGDVGEAAKFGGLFGGIGAKGGSPNAAAKARNDAQLTKDIKRGATKAPARIGNDVDFRADQLIDAMDDAPDVRKALVTQARSNPQAAGGKVKSALAEATAGNDAVYDAIQQHHGGVDLGDVTVRLANLRDKFHGEGHAVASDAVGRVLDDMAERYWSNPGGKLTAEQLRNIRNDLGDIAFPGGGAKPKGARAAMGSVYDEFNGAIEDVARTTPGVDVDALVARNKQISSMLPVGKALGSRVASEADRELGMFGTAKDKIKKSATGLNRRMRYSAEQTGADNPALMGAPVYGPLGAAARNTVGEPEVDPLPPRKSAAQFLMNGGVR